MLRRPWSCVLVLATTALAPTARAAGVVSSTVYRLENDTGKPLDHVFLNFVPQGAIVPPAANVTPVTDVTASAGFDTSKLDSGIFAFKQTPSSATQQSLGLDFTGGNFGFPGADGKPVTPTGQPLGLGQWIRFQLNVDPGLAPQLVLSPLDPPTGLLLTQQVPAPPSPPPVTAAAGGPPPTVNTPEPLSLVVWSSLAALGLARARAYRRSHRTA